MSYPFIIAELSGNHNGEISRAIDLLLAAKDAGADAVKLQTYTADTITINHNSDDFMVKGGLWDGRSLYELYQQAHTPWEWHEELFAKAREIGIMLFSTPFDETAVDLLESLNAPLYKIASFELTHHPLIAYVAKTKKPLIMSTGLATLEEITKAVNVATDNGCNDLTLLHCISEYPAAIENCNLAMIPDLQKRFPKCKIGLSDHTLGITVALASIALGAVVIEKHVTLDREDGGVDSAFSLEPRELHDLCTEARKVSLALGKVSYTRSEAEKRNMIFRRSLYITQNIKKGEMFTDKNVRVIRPGYGLAPEFLPKILGRIAEKDYIFGQALDEGCLNE